MQALPPSINLPKGRFSAYAGKSNSICIHIYTHRYYFPTSRAWDTAPWLKCIKDVTTPDFWRDCTTPAQGGPEY